MASKARKPATGPCLSPKPGKLIYPVRVLRDQVAALEAAISLASADPEKKSVHKLRISARRIEAQLALLSFLKDRQPELRHVQKPAQRLKRLLSSLRKAAGRVRDLDVQIDLTKQHIADLSKEEKRQAKDLRSTLKRRRTRKAHALVAVLEEHVRKLAPKLEKLLGAFDGSQEITLTVVELATLTDRWYTTYASQPGKAPVSEQSLHGIRKAAKLARYMAEGASEKTGTSPLTQLASTFESLQEQGGTWHDLLTLRKAAQHHLGKHAQLTERLARREEGALQAFQQALTTSAR